MTCEGRDRYFSTLGCNGCGVVTATSILRNARLCQRLAEAACNRDLTPREVRRLAEAEKNIAALAATFGATACIGGDPRGYVVKLLLPGGQYNTWGGPEEGYGVPA